MHSTAFYSFTVLLILVFSMSSRLKTLVTAAVISYQVSASAVPLTESLIRNPGISGLGASMVHRQVDKPQERDHILDVVPQPAQRLAQQRPRRTEFPAFTMPPIPTQLQMTARQVVDAMFGTDRAEMVRAISCLRFHDGDSRFNTTVLNEATRRLNDPRNTSALARLFGAYRDHVAAAPHTTPLGTPAPANSVQLWLNSLVGAPHTDADLVANRAREQDLNRQAGDARRAGNPTEARRLDEEGRTVRRPTGMVHNPEYQTAISAVVRRNGANLVPEFSAQMAFIQGSLRQNDHDAGRIPTQSFNPNAPRYYALTGLNGYFAFSAGSAAADRETGISLLALAYTLSAGVPRTTAEGGYGNGQRPGWPLARTEVERVNRLPRWATESDALIQSVSGTQ